MLYYKCNNIYNNNTYNSTIMHVLYVQKFEAPFIFETNFFVHFFKEQEHYEHNVDF